MEQNFIVTGIKRVILVGKDEYPERITEFRGGLRSNELIFHISGDCVVRFNGKVLRDTENTVRFLPEGENREYVVERLERGECIDVFFSTDRPVAEEAFVIKLQNGTALAGYFRKLFSLWVAKEEGYYHACLSLLYRILSELQKSEYFPLSRSEVLRPALDYINEHFLLEKISTGLLAEKCGISESGLKKLFLKKFGIPPVRYMIQLKIRYACDLLRTERYTVTRTAELCGYNNVYFFSRQFKEYMGISPQTFVEKYRSSK